MEHKGNKSEKTIHAEIAFMAAMKAMGLGVLNEYRILEHTIDFMVGFRHSNERSVYYISSVGVELKTSLGDMLSGTGINFWAFPFNYLLVTEDIAYSAIKWIENNEDLKHVGILIVMDDYRIEFYKQAQFVQDKAKYCGKLIRAINECNPEKYYDSVAWAFAANDDEHDIVTVHNFANNNTSMIKVSCEIEERTIADTENDCEVKP